MMSSWETLYDLRCVLDDGKRSPFFCGFPSAQPSAGIDERETICELVLPFFFFKLFTTYFGHVRFLFFFVALICACVDENLLSLRLLLPTCMFT